MKYAMALGLLAFSIAPSAQDMSPDEAQVREFVRKSCAFHACGEGDVVVTSYSKGSPAVGCPTKDLSIYANFVITNAALGITEKAATGETAYLMKTMRANAGVSSFEEAARGCWRLEHKQRVIILQYSERGAVKVSPVRGGAPYWTQSNHLDRP